MYVSGMVIVRECNGICHESAVDIWLIIPVVIYEGIVVSEHGNIGRMIHCVALYRRKVV